MKSTAENLRIDILNRHISESILRALRGESYLDPEVLKIPGFATPTMRHLFSNLCHIEDAVYLEVGVHCGTSFVSAFNNNPIHAIGIDNFSQPFNEPNFRHRLADNLNSWKHTAKKVEFFDADCWSIDRSLIPPVDVFYYDGEHSQHSQGRALPSFFEQMADRFIFIVDDYHWDSVAAGTADGFEKLKGKMLIEREWTLSGEMAQDDPIWHNGMAIFLVSKVDGMFEIR